jgi:hypothetical protein
MAQRLVHIHKIDDSSDLGRTCLVNAPTNADSDEVAEEVRPVPREPEDRHAKEDREAETHGDLGLGGQRVF